MLEIIMIGILLIGAGIGIIVNSIIEKDFEASEIALSIGFIVLGAVIIVLSFML